MFAFYVPDLLTCDLPRFDPWQLLWSQSLPGAILTTELGKTFVCYWVWPQVREGGGERKGEREVRKESDCILQNRGTLVHRGKQKVLALAGGLKCDIYAGPQVKKAGLSMGIWSKMSHERGWRHR